VLEQKMVGGGNIWEGSKIESSGWFSFSYSTPILHYSIIPNDLVFSCHSMVSLDLKR